MKEVEAPPIVVTGTKLEETSPDFYEHFLEHQENGASNTNL